MKKLLIVFAAILLSGCAATPMEIRAMNRSFVVQSSRDPYSAARCVARNFENIYGRYLASVREGVTPDSYEVVLFAGGSSMMAVVDALPQDKGSQLTFFFLNLTIGVVVNELLDAGRKCQS